VTETAQMYESLSVEENLLFYSAMYDIEEGKARARMKELLGRLGLPDKRTAKLGALSTGMKKRIHLARALMHEPDILFLDEPTSGLDPEIARETIAFIRELATERGTTVLLCTHNLSLAELVCDSFGFIYEGTMQVSGSGEELRRASRLKDSLLVRTTNGDFRYPLEGLSEINGTLASLMGEDRGILEARRESPGLEELYFHFIKEAEREIA
jgi:ABC-2 type transport system ATP-binding protein